MGTLLIIFGSVFSTAGDVILRYWLESNNRLTYVWGLLCYFISMNCLALAFRYKPIAVASVLCVVLNIVMLLLITKVFFGDQLHPAHWAGIGLGLLAIVVLELAQ